MTTDSTGEAIRATRERAALFVGESRGWLEVGGEDRVRWLDGMISGDVEALAAAGEGAGCYATLLTNRGAIVADLHVGRLGERFVLESLRSEIPRIAEVLDRFIIADDVSLEHRSAGFVNLGLEGPASGGILRAALGERDLPDALCWRAATIAGHDVLIGAFGWSGELAYQLRVPTDGRQAVEGALDEAAGGTLVRGAPEALEVLRVEAGIPLLGRELDEEVLPPEARLEHAVSTTKGCYVGQEIVARLRARGQVNHLLVGLRLEDVGDAAPEAGAALRAGDRVTGELTSIVRSPSEGPIALGYVRREHAEPGTEVAWPGGHARVAALPFVATGVDRGGHDEGDGAART